jgi:hypothetical protein
MQALAQLRHDLEQRFPDALPLARGLAAAVATGIRPIDHLLPGGGLARGRVTLWKPGGGATAVLRAAAYAAIERGERAAWIDGAGSQVMGFVEGPLLVRPKGDIETVVCAEELLRCGGFSLVVLSGGGRQAADAAIRLGRAARAGGSGFVLIGTDATVAHMRVQTRILPDGYRWRYNPFGEPVEPESAEIELTANSLGWSGRARVVVPLQVYPQRLGPEQGLVDRRGAPRQVRWRSPIRRNKNLASLDTNR